MRWLGSLGAGAAIMLTYTHVENTLDRRHLEERITAETRLPDTAPPSLRVWADLVRDTALDPRVAVAVPGNKPGDEKIYKNYMVNSERRDGRSFVKMPEALMAMTSAGNPEFDDHYKHHGLMAMSDELSDQLTEEINQAKLGEPLATADKSPDANALRAMHLINKTIAKTMAQAALTERSSHPTDAQLNKAVLAAFHIPSGVVEQYFTAFNNAAANPDILKSTESFRKFFLKLAPEPKKGQNPTVYATRYADAAKVIGDPNKPYKNVANSKLMGGQN
jgi:hypothetical protein